MMGKLNCFTAFLLIFLSFIVFARAEEIEPGVIVCTPESTDPFCMEIKTQEMYTTLYQTLAPGCEKQWKKSSFLECYFGESRHSTCSGWQNSKCYFGVSATFTCEYDVCVLEKYKLDKTNWFTDPKKVSTAYYHKGDTVTLTSKLHCNSENDWYIYSYAFRQYSVTGTPSCPTGDLRKVFVGCENRQKVYDVYKITYVPRSCISKPYCEKKEEFLGKDYENVECCVNEDCPTGYVCSNYKCVQVEAPAPPPETPPPEENITVPPEENITKPVPPEEKPTEALSIIIWIIIFGVVGYFAYRRLKR